VLDARKRRQLRITLIYDPAVALLAWVQLGPPLSDNFRKTYRQLLRWNDELPFAKFTVSEDERPILTLELPAADVDQDALGALLARALAIADLVHPQAMVLMGDLRRTYPKLVADAEPEPSGPALLERYAAQVAELGEAALAAP
jgi:Putative bacterial sensory transduction regulator